MARAVEQLSYEEILCLDIFAFATEQKAYTALVNQLGFLNKLKRENQAWPSKPIAPLAIGGKSTMVARLRSQILNSSCEEKNELNCSDEIVLPPSQSPSRKKRNWWWP